MKTNGVVLGRRVATPLIVSAITLAACTTAMRPVTCEGGPYRCKSPSDVKFCESEVVAVEGADCADLGLAPSKHFCFVTQATCTHTDYRVKDRSCRIVEYRPLREWRECSPGTPTFIDP